MADNPAKATPEQADRLHRFAHDVRNRLAAIAQVLQHLPDAAESERAELTGFAEQQYFKAMREVESLLDDLAVDRTPRLSEPAPIDLGSLVREAIEDQRYRLERKGQRLVASVPEGITVTGDAHQLGSLMRALISNACKFTHREGTITIDLKRAGDLAEVRVKDSGVGLDAEDLQQVFVRYAWLKSRSTDGEAQGRSTLARAQQWATAHGGGLEALSAGPDQGCTFILRLPLAA